MFFAWSMPRLRYGSPAGRYLRAKTQSEEDVDGRKTSTTQFQTTTRIDQASGKELFRFDPSSTTVVDPILVDIVVHGGKQTKRREWR